ncbi:hypothetical protein CYMTET_11725 [Cymbomonas tetramitiformis]|uniref:Uncharacterized protein n=1 Tax=Cymbomonas tetramitiformis TaxID=36881 RepID=A0AAE0LCV8_9CHLO|nr:hypothetical protein CYMTET_11725 [Cymbomonas tetramitiformis]
MFSELTRPSGSSQTTTRSPLWEAFLNASASCFLMLGLMNMAPSRSSRIPMHGVEHSLGIFNLYQTFLIFVVFFILVKVLFAQIIHAKSSISVIFLVDTTYRGCASLCEACFCDISPMDIGMEQVAWKELQDLLRNLPTPGFVQASQDSLRLHIEPLLRLQSDCVAGISAQHVNFLLSVWEAVAFIRLCDDYEFSSPFSSAQPDTLFCTGEFCLTSLSRSVELQISPDCRQRLLSLLEVISLQGAGVKCKGQFYDSFFETEIPDIPVDERGEEHPQTAPPTPAPVRLCPISYSSEDVTEHQGPSQRSQNAVLDAINQMMPEALPGKGSLDVSEEDGVASDRELSGHTPECRVAAYLLNSLGCIPRLLQACTSLLLADVDPNDDLVDSDATRMEGVAQFTLQTLVFVRNLLGGSNVHLADPDATEPSFLALADALPVAFQVDLDGMDSLPVAAYPSVPLAAALLECAGGVQGASGTRLRFEVQRRLARVLLAGQLDQVEPLSEAAAGGLPLAVLDSTQALAALTFRVSPRRLCHGLALLAELDSFASAEATAHGISRDVVRAAYAEALPESEESVTCLLSLVALTCSVAWAPLCCADLPPEAPPSITETEDDLLAELHCESGLGPAGGEGRVPQVPLGSPGWSSLQESHGADQPQLDLTCLALKALEVLLQVLLGEGASGKGRKAAAQRLLQKSRMSPTTLPGKGGAWDAVPLLCERHVEALLWVLYQLPRGGEGFAGVSMSMNTFGSEVPVDFGASMMSTDSASWGYHGSAAVAVSKAADFLQRAISLVEVLSHPAVLPAALHGHLARQVLTRLADPPLSVLVVGGRALLTWMKTCLVVRVAADEEGAGSSVLDQGGVGIWETVLSSLQMEGTDAADDKQALQILPERAQLLLLLFHALSEPARVRVLQCTLRAVAATMAPTGEAPETTTPALEGQLPKQPLVIETSPVAASLLVQAHVTLLAEYMVQHFAGIPAWLGTTIRDGLIMQDLVAVLAGSHAGYNGPLPRLPPPTFVVAQAAASSGLCGGRALLALSFELRTDCVAAEAMASTSAANPSAALGGGGMGRGASRAAVEQACGAEGSGPGSLEGLQAHLLGILNGSVSGGVRSLDDVGSVDDAIDEALAERFSAHAAWRLLLRVPPPASSEPGRLCLATSWPSTEPLPAGQLLCQASWVAHGWALADTASSPGAPSAATLLGSLRAARATMEACPGAAGAAGSARLEGCRAGFSGAAAAEQLLRLVQLGLVGWLWRRGVSVELPGTLHLDLPPEAEGEGGPVGESKEDVEGESKGGAEGDPDTGPEGEPEGGPGREAVEDCRQAGGLADAVQELLESSGESWEELLVELGALLEVLSARLQGALRVALEAVLGPVQAQCTELMLRAGLPAAELPASLEQLGVMGGVEAVQGLLHVDDWEEWRANTVADAVVELGFWGEEWADAAESAEVGNGKLVLRHVLAPGLTHGLLSGTHAASGTITSCLLVLHALLDASVLCLRAGRVHAAEKDALETLEQGVGTQRVLHTVVGMLQNTSFVAVHPQCRAVAGQLLQGAQQLEAVDVALAVRRALDEKGLVHLEDLIAPLLPGDGHLPAHEAAECAMRCVLGEAVNGMMRLMEHPSSRQQILNHFLGAEPHADMKPEGGTAQRGVHKGDLGCVILLLEGVRSEEVSARALQLLILLTEGRTGDVPFQSQLRGELRRQLLRLGSPRLGAWLQRHLIGVPGGLATPFTMQLAATLLQLLMEVRGGAGDWDDLGMDAGGLEGDEPAFSEERMQLLDVMLQQLSAALTCSQGEQYLALLTCSASATPGGVLQLVSAVIQQIGAAPGEEGALPGLKGDVPAPVLAFLEKVLRHVAEGGAGVKMLSLPQAVVPVPQRQRARAGSDHSTISCSSSIGGGGGSSLGAGGSGSFLNLEVAAEMRRRSGGTRAEEARGGGGGGNSGGGRSTRQMFGLVGRSGGTGSSEGVGGRGGGGRGGGGREEEDVVGSESDGQSAGSGPSAATARAGGGGIGPGGSAHPSGASAAGGVGAAGGRGEENLAHAVCTFTSSGSSFMEQHWYFCYTCDLTLSKGCCSVCARVCHRGHKVVYSRFSRFFCDCGAGSVHGATCICLQPRQLMEGAAGASASATASAGGMGLQTGGSGPPSSDTSDSEADSDSLGGGDEGTAETGRARWDMAALVLPGKGAAVMKAALEAGLEGRLVELLWAQLRHLKGEVDDIAARMVAAAEHSQLLLQGAPLQWASLPAIGGPGLLHSSRTGSKSSEEGAEVHRAVPTGPSGRPAVLASLRRSFKSGSFDLKAKSEHVGSRELRQKVAAGALTRSALTCSSRGHLAVAEGDRVCLLDVSALLGPMVVPPAATGAAASSGGAAGSSSSRTGSGLGVGGAGGSSGGGAREGGGSGGGGSSDRVGVRPLSRNVSGFDVSQVAFCPANSAYLAVTGLRECQVYTISSRGEVVDRLALELSLNPSTGADEYILQVDWLPGTQTHLVVTTPLFVKLYNLSQDAISPEHCLSLLDGRIAAISLATTGVHHDPVCFIMSQQGILYREPLCATGSGGESLHIIANALEVPREVQGLKGKGVHFSGGQGLLIASYDGGATLLARMDPGLSVLVQASPLLPGTSGSSMPKGTCQWADLVPIRQTAGAAVAGAVNGGQAPPLPPAGLLCVPHAPQPSLAVSFTQSTVWTQPLHPSPASVAAAAAATAGGSAGERERSSPLRSGPPGSSSAGGGSATANGGAAGLHVEGWASVCPAGKEQPMLMLLHSDGSLQMYACPVPPAGLSSSGSAVRGSGAAVVKSPSRSHSGGISGGAAAGGSVQGGDGTAFPVDFFERCVLATAEMKFGGDFLRATDSDGAKLSLSSEEGYVEAPGAGAFRFVVQNPNPENVLVGVRMHVGQSSPSHTPVEVRIFGRSVQLEEGVRRWYDLPFTTAESLLADQEATLTVGPALHEACAPRVDQLEVYVQSKEEFGFKEKLEAQEADALPATSASLSLIRRRELELPPTAKATAAQRTLSGVLRLLHLYSHALHAEGLSPPAFPGGLGRLVRAAAGGERGGVWQACLEVLTPLAMPWSDVAQGSSGAALAVHGLSGRGWELGREAQRWAWKVLCAQGQPRAECQLAKDTARLRLAASAVRWCAQQVATPTQAPGSPGGHVAVPGPGQNAGVVQTYLGAVQTIRRVAKLRPGNLSVVLGEESGLLRMLVAQLDGVVADSSLELDPSDVVAGLVDILCGSVAAHPGEHVHLEALEEALEEEQHLQHAQEAREQEAGGEGGEMADLMDGIMRLLRAPSAAVRGAASSSLLVGLLQHGAGGGRTAGGGAPESAWGDDAESKAGSTGSVMTSSGRHAMGAGAPGSLAIGGAVSQHGFPSGLVSEDGTATMTQYCCDVCSVCPILGRRWHCAVCPDFDMCEECYHHCSPNDFPPQHELSHVMTPLPVDEDGAASSMAGAVGSMASSGPASMASSPPASPTLSSTTSMSTSMAHPPPPSSDQSAAESHSTDSGAAWCSSYARLASLLVEQLAALPATSGEAALPAMQLLQGLVSSSPYAGALAERAVELTLKELDLEGGAARHLAQGVDSPMAHMLLLRLMLLSLLLRTWRACPVSAAPAEPGGDCTQDAARRLLQAPAMRAFLLDLLLLVTELLPPASAPGTGDCMTVAQQTETEESPGAEAVAPGYGALLVSRVPAGAVSYTPFFSDSHVRGRERGHLFEHLPRQLVEVALRLTFALTLPEHGGAPVPLEPWQDLLCDYLAPQVRTTAGARKYARRLLLGACSGTRSTYHTVRDLHLYNVQMMQLRTLATTGAAAGGAGRLPYELHVGLLRCLSAMAEASAVRPANWRRLCAVSDPEALPLVVRVALRAASEEVVLAALKLLTAVLPTTSGHAEDTSPASSTRGEPPGRGGKAGGTSGTCSKALSATGTGVGGKAAAATAVSLGWLLEEQGGLLGRFVEELLLGFNAAPVRQQAQAVLQGVWHSLPAGAPEQVRLAKFLFECIPRLPPYGQNAAELVALVTWLLTGADADAVGTSGEGRNGGAGWRDAGVEAHQRVMEEAVQEDTLVEVVKALKVQNALVAHPNSAIYTSLMSLLEMEGFYLRACPASPATARSRPYNRLKLQHLKAETKYTDNRILIKCISCHSIRSIALSIHDLRRSRMIRTLHIYYNNRPGELSELKNNWSAWHRVATCSLRPAQTELKVDLLLPITACNLMVELDSFHFSLQASAQEVVQCPRCSRVVTDRHGICKNCHENAYQCRQCRNINYENLDAFLCNECGHSRYGRLELSFQARPSFEHDALRGEEDVRQARAVIEAESDAAHRRYQQLVGFKKPLMKLLASIEEGDVEPKESLQQMMVSMPLSSSFKINRKMAILGVLYGEKCRGAYDGIARGMHILAGAREALLMYLAAHNAPLPAAAGLELCSAEPRACQRPPNKCFGCANTFSAHCLEILAALAPHAAWRRPLLAQDVPGELFRCNLHCGPKPARGRARAVVGELVKAEATAAQELHVLLQRKVHYCLENHRSINVAACVHEELQLLAEVAAETPSGPDAIEVWQARLRVVFDILFRAVRAEGAASPAVCEHVLLPCLTIILQTASPAPQRGAGAPAREPHLPAGQPLQGRVPGGGGAFAGEDGAGCARVAVEYSAWAAGKDSFQAYTRRLQNLEAAEAQARKGKGVPTGQDRRDAPARPRGVAVERAALRWRGRAASRSGVGAAVSRPEMWVDALLLSPASSGVRASAAGLVQVLSGRAQHRHFLFLGVLAEMLPKARGAGEAASDFFTLLTSLAQSEVSRRYLVARGLMAQLCAELEKEITAVQQQEQSPVTDISQGLVVKYLAELLGLLLQLPDVRTKFVQGGHLGAVLRVMLAIKCLEVHLTKLLSEAAELLAGVLAEVSSESDGHREALVRSCTESLELALGAAAQGHSQGQAVSILLAQLCNVVCPTKPEPDYLLLLNKAQTQEEFIRGAMTKNPYSSKEVGRLMRDVKNHVCRALEMQGLIEDDHAMELLVAGRIVALDLPVSKVYEQVWLRTVHAAPQPNGRPPATTPGAAGASAMPPMPVMYRLQGLDGEATEPRVDELDEDKVEELDPEEEFRVTRVLAECGGLRVLLQWLHHAGGVGRPAQDHGAQTTLLLRLLAACCQLRQNRLQLLRLGALPLLLTQARCAFATASQAAEAESLLLILEKVATEASAEAGLEAHMEPAAFAAAAPVGQTTPGAAEDPAAPCVPAVDATEQVEAFLEKLKALAAAQQRRGADTVARILPFLAAGDARAMRTLLDHFMPCLDLAGFDRALGTEGGGGTAAAAQRRLQLDIFVKVLESIPQSALGARLQTMLLERGVVRRVAQYLVESFKGCEKGSAEFAAAVEQPGVPYALALLYGVALNHQAASQAVGQEEGLLQLVHALEGVSSEGGAGSHAENLLEALAAAPGEEAGLRMQVEGLRTATREELKRRALQRREQMLAEMGMRRMEIPGSGGERIVAATSPSSIDMRALADLNDEEDEVLSCMVCREGYAAQPSELLGVYCFCKRIRIRQPAPSAPASPAPPTSPGPTPPRSPGGTAAGPSGGVGMPVSPSSASRARSQSGGSPSPGGTAAGGGRSELGYSSVSHFNVIHFSCHAAAKRADASLKTPKKEWEGATLRNNETLCNNLLPIRGDKVREGDYTRCCDHFWGGLQALGRGDGGRVHLATHDLAALLGRFAVGASFSVDAHGGGRESNMKMLLFLIPMARHLLDLATPVQRAVYQMALASAIPSAAEGGAVRGRSAGSWGSIGGEPASPPANSQHTRSMPNSPGVGGSADRGVPSMPRSPGRDSAVMTPTSSHSVPNSPGSGGSSGGGVLSRDLMVGAGLGGEERGGPYLLMLALLLLSPAAWQRCRRELLVIALQQPWLRSFYPQVLAPRSGSAPSTPGVSGSGAGPSSSGGPGEAGADMESPAGMWGSPSPSSSPGPSASFGGRAEAAQLAEPQETEVEAEARLLAETRPMLLFFGVIEQLQQALKPRATGAGREDPQLVQEGNPDEPWVAAMHSKLQNISEMLQVSDRMLEFVEEIESATDLQEAFDIMEVLRDVLEDGCSSSVEFVQSCIDQDDS